MTRIRVSSGSSGGRARDFILLAPARSGSNMLASALNSHPNIVCFGDFFAGEDFEWLGGDVVGDVIDGELVHQIRALRERAVVSDKLILLIRHPADIVTSRLSLYKRRYSHMLKDGSDPVTTYASKSAGVNPWAAITEEIVSDELDEMFAFVKRRDGLVVNYEVLTELGGEALNPDETNRLCDYLGVGRAPLVPVTKKLPDIRVSL